jgi:eukaryotic-like serine/threonine-protein kinase
MQKNWWIWLIVPAAATTALLVAVVVFAGEGDDEVSGGVVITRTTQRGEPESSIATTRSRARRNTDAATPARTSPGTTPTTDERRTEATNVPNLYGLTRDQAVAELEEAGLRATIRREKSFQPDGLVFEQTPRSGQRLRQGRAVLVTVSVFKSRAPVPPRPRAPPVSAVPDVVGLDYWEAAARMEIRGVVANLYPVRSNRAYAIVIRQAPIAGAQVRRGSRVRLSVSRGTRAVPAFPVPDTVGLSELAAHARCRDVNFTCRTVLVPARRPTEAGRVVRQRPRAGSTARGLTQMTLYVGG